jgi:hypothetical protein
MERLSPAHVYYVHTIIEAFQISGGIVYFSQTVATISTTTFHFGDF